MLLTRKGAIPVVADVVFTLYNHTIGLKLRWEYSATRLGKHKVLEPSFLDSSLLRGKNPAYPDMSLLFPKGHPLRFCLALGLQHRLPARHLAPVRHRHLARAKGPASRVLRVLDRCRRRCFQPALSLLLLPSARWRAALSPRCLDSKPPNSRALAPVPPALVSADQPLSFWSHRLYFWLLHEAHLKLYGERRPSALHTYLRITLRKDTGYGVELTVEDVAEVCQPHSKPPPQEAWHTPRLQPYH